MIKRDEIEAKAAEFQIHPANVERDYVFGWLLTGIYSVSELQNLFILKGGNCFRKAYFPATRFSNDLDFSTQSSVSEEFLAVEFRRVCEFAGERSGVEFEIERTRVEVQNEIDDRRKIYGIRVYFKDFYGNPDKFTISVSMDVTELDRIYLPTQRRMLIHPYSDAEACRTELQCLKLEEMLASKLKCLLQRRHIPDLYDLAFSILINRDIEVNRTEVITTFFQKTIFERSPAAAKELFLGLPFHLMKEAWSKYIICPVRSLLPWDGAIDAFRGFVEALFAPYGGEYASVAFYPSSLRNLIMDAGLDLRLLRLTYDGVPRIVEPYSLVFKRRQDGVGREYFYVYDRTGGRQSGPGIKSLVHEKVENLEMADEKFEPRYLVELSKAGEFTGKTYFGSSFGRVRAFGVGRTASRRRGSGLRYTYECNYCNRRFVRSKRDDHLKEHKDKYGNRCYGRRATLVGQDYR